jgi:hypothetical protein
MEEKMNVQKVTDAVVGIATGGGDYATHEDFRRMAKEIASSAMDIFSGKLLRKAIDLSLAVIEFADELEASQAENDLE